ncbi:MULTISPECIES: trypsin-like serine peptidase [Parageobacillus]|uniref:Serine protease n=1 Tax=Parageobacillus galactosidasius TaxID=883812 RepID=A0A226QJT4_9BACL|nr:MULTISPECIES: trypsin-like serine protease [Parageobacillus]MED4988000.1 trypsin-like peptidase domain-containing protein [Parageobacillus toebii]OXB92803.1 glutamyl endopeptidase [Parageobacillus galactosidasius]
MKNFFASILFLLCLLLIPLTSFANEIEDYHPYDMVNSKGEVIKYADYIKKLNTSSTREKKENYNGTGEILPMRQLPDYKKYKPYKSLNPSTTSEAIEKLIFPYVVIGDDGRRVVEDTSASPFKQISYIELEWDNFWGWCTGTLIGKDTVLTNAHCVIDPYTKQGIRSAYVIPGLNNNHYSYGAYEVVDYFVTSHWINTGDSSQDFAVLKLAPYLGKNAGDVAGYLPIRQVTNIVNQTIKIYGYPADKINATGTFSQWGMSGSVEREDTNLAFYKLDTYNGQSGAAMLNSSNEIVGVHRGGYVFSDGQTFNGGPKMIKPVYDFIKAAQ